MKGRGGISLLLALAFLGCAFLVGSFALENRSAFSFYSKAFSPGADVVNAKTAAIVSVGEPVNINTATAEQLQTLPGIGPALAQRILSYRAENGPFASVAELTKIEGIGIKRLEKLLGHITTGG